jgi:putative FmdB family regulatory protein
VTVAPTYDYLCDACDHAFEAFHSMSDRPLRKCPECGKPRLQRLFGTGGGIIFKGSGFYETDYRRKSGTPPAGKKEGEGSKAEPKTGAKAASKPEPKPDSRPAPKKDPKKP